MFLPQSYVHAKATGRSLSEIVERYLSQVALKTERDWKPKPGSGVEQWMNPIPESKKVDDYDKLKYEALKEKYDLDENID